MAMRASGPWSAALAAPRNSASGSVGETRSVTSRSESASARPDVLTDASMYDTASATSRPRIDNPPASENIVIHRTTRSLALLQRAETHRRRDILLATSRNNVLGASISASSARVWHKDYLNELAYAQRSKERAAAKMAAQTAAEALSLRRDRLKYLHGGHLPSSNASTASHEHGKTTFMERMDAQTRSASDGRSEVVMAAAFAARTDKLVCSECGTEQTFQEYRNRVKRCKKEACAGAEFRPRATWATVGPRFLSKLDDFLAHRDERAERARAASLPPFRVTHKHVFDADSGALVAEPVPVHVWADVAEEFFERQAEFERKRSASAAAARSFKAAPLPYSFTPETNTHYKMRTPLPDFHERQRIAAERRSLTWEERMAEWEEKYGPVLPKPPVKARPRSSSK